MGQLLAPGPARQGGTIGAMGWWSLDGEPDEIMGDQPADLATMAMGQLKNEGGGPPTQAQLLTEIAQTIGAHPLPKAEAHRRLVAVRMVHPGGVLAVTPPFTAPAWGQALLTELVAAWRMVRRRPPSHRELAETFTFVLGPTMEPYTSDGTLLEDIELEWEDSRGRLSFSDSFAILHASLVAVLPSLLGGTLTLDALTVTLESGEELKVRPAPATLAADVAEAGERLSRRAATSLDLDLLLGLALDNLISRRDRHTLTLDGVAPTRLAMVLRSKHRSVRHATLGEGRVLADLGDKARVHFADGSEKVLVNRMLTDQRPANQPFTVSQELNAVARDQLRT
jgi:hypothetical protein